MPTVKPGDCFSSLAKENGYFNYLTLYDHTDNVVIQLKRTNPNMLAEGDVYKIPAKRQKNAALDLDLEKRFVVDRKLTNLRLGLFDHEDKALVPTECTLVVGPLTSNALPAAGLLETPIDPKVKSGTVNFKLAPWKKPVVPPVIVPPVVVDKPPHPPTIEAKEFEDKFEEDEESDKPLEVEIKLQLGYLEPHTEIRGAIRRLNNLGCKVPKPDAKTAVDNETKQVVKSYQKFKGNDNPSGAIADLRAALETSHDKI